MKLAIRATPGWNAASEAPEGSGNVFCDCGHLLEDDVLDVAEACVSAQRRTTASIDQVSDELEAARAAVSESALSEILARGTDIHGISSESGISNVVTFNTSNIADTVSDRTIAELRESLDRQMERILRALFQSPGRLNVSVSGHFWYPAGGYMGWHTNNRAPGWRAYLTHAIEPGKSFFRYRHPQSGEIITSMDNRWDLRVFHVNPDAPLWHAVYSETDRFSFGYLIQEKSLLRSVISRARNAISGSVGRSRPPD